MARLLQENNNPLLCEQGGYLLVDYSSLPLSKNYLYEDIEDTARLRADVIDEPLISPTLALLLISANIQNIGDKISALETPWYAQTDNFGFSGESNPYIVDMTLDIGDNPVNPFFDLIKKVTYISANGNRVSMKMLSYDDAENINYSSLIFSYSFVCTQIGSSLGLYFGDSVSPNIDNDRIEVTFYRQPIIANVSRSSYVDVPDKYVPLLIDMTVKSFLQHKSKGKMDANILQDISTQIAGSYQNKQVELQADKN